MQAYRNEEQQNRSIDGEVAKASNDVDKYLSEVTEQR